MWYATNVLKSLGHWQNAKTVFFLLLHVIMYFKKFNYNNKKFIQSKEQKNDQTLLLICVMIKV